MAGTAEPLGIPEDHVGRPNEVCRTCHQPPVIVAAKPTPLPIPTPIRHPESGGKDSCLECHRSLGGQHLDIVIQWQGSIHALYDVGCADCHGGDPGASEKVVAKSPQAGYIGSPPRSAIPELCGSCHADPERMRPYELPVDQLRDYKESVHGQRLAEGDENAATCYDCHGGHAVKEAIDPTSSIHPKNLPATCARCHADEERMKPYGIAVNQYELYQESVHGRALLIKGNTEAPSCPTCHTSHGAALPGYAEVIDVCGQCHSAAKKYYLTGGHRSGRERGSKAPRCITCHGRYDVQSPTLDLFLGDEPRHCGACHAPDSLERAAIEAMYQTLARAEEALQGAEQTLEKARAQGLSLEAPASRLQAARAELAEAAAAQHAVRLETIQERTDKVEAISAEVQRTVEEAIARREQTQLLPGKITAAVLVAGGIVFAILRRRARIR